MNTVCIIQARMGSSRLPGKVMKLLANREVLWHVYNRVSHCKLIDKIVIATSTHARDDIIESYCHSENWYCNRGSEHDVLQRYAQTASKFEADIVVRVTSDCPLIDPLLITKLVTHFNATAVDYLSTNYPVRTFPVGLDCEIVLKTALKYANRESTNKYEREHVTPFIYRNPDLFKIGEMRNAVDESDIRLTLDTVEDYKLLTRIYDKLYKTGDIIEIGDVVNFLGNS